ncbi:MAG: Ig domain-containing protein [Bacteroidales bacterium]|nr:Ig domain-containing protein [Bacteroidales bacterium]
MNRRIALLLLMILPVVFSCTEKEPEVEQVIRVESVTISKNTAELTIGETLQLSASVSPSSATNKEISWSSSNQSVASVNASGLVTAVGEGTTIISASADGKKGECTVSVKKAYVAVSEVKLDKTELTLFEGKEETLTASVLPKDATEQTITWSSSDPSIATVVSGKVTAIKAGNATISATVGSLKAECDVTVYLEYGKVAISDLRPVEILPVVGQVVTGDKQVYDHIEHLRLAEATRIRDMMWEYGAGSHSKEAYRQLMDRLNAGMIDEYPSGYSNFEIIDGVYSDSGDRAHAHNEWSILVSLLNHVNLKVVFTQGDQWQEKLDKFIRNSPQSLLVFGCSSFWEGDKKTFSQMSMYKSIRELCTTGKIIVFSANGNIKRRDGSYINKTLHRDCDEEGQGYYNLSSNTNGKNDPVASSSLLVTVGTNAAGDCDQTGETTSSSRFPVGFHDKVLFAGRAFPAHELKEDLISAEGGNSNHGKYATSYVNYVNVAMMSICFQMYAEAKDVFELLDMVRSTCLTDYIRLDGQTQPLQLINPAGLYKKYLSPQNLPATISSGETIHLDKGYYKGVIFSIPGAEVKVNGEWIAFDNKNKDVIMSQNPMNLEWRLNSELLQEYGYTSGQTIEGQIITVDDKWGGLRLEVPMTIKIQ